MPIRRSLICGFLLVVLLGAQLAVAEVVRIDVRRRDDFGTHERIIGRVRFAVDPNLPANRGIVDLALAPKNSDGKVEFSSDVLFFRPKDPAKARGTVFLEAVNVGRDQSLVIMSGAVQRDMAPESWNLGDRFLLDQGFTVAFLGWQFDVRRDQGLTFEAAYAPVDGLVRDTFVETDPSEPDVLFSLRYCSYAPGRPEATLSYRKRMDEAPRPVPRDAWRFGDDGCSVYMAKSSGIGIYEVIYQAKESPVAGLGMAALRDFASYLRFGASDAVLRETPGALQRVIGYGYSQSARLLRELVRDGFTADERGRQVFDGMMILSAGAGVGSFNHRFAMPEQSGNSVMSVLRPVDIPPFNDEELLAKAQTARAVPKIFYTFTSTDYWSRAGSLVTTSQSETGAGLKDEPLAQTSRLYFLPGTAGTPGPLPLAKRTLYESFQHFMNFSQQRWVQRALLIDLDAWVRNESAPPPSQYPTIAKRELVPLADVQFPKAPQYTFPTFMPIVWRMNFGSTFRTAGVISVEPPSTGVPYRLLVPQVTSDGIDVDGVRLPEVAVPLGTYTGWNQTVFEYKDLRYLSGLVGGFEPFARTTAVRAATGDPRPSIAERYSSKEDYLAKIQRAADDLARQRFLLRDDIPFVLQRAEAMWNVIVEQ